MKYWKFTIQYNVEKNDLGLSNMLTQKKYILIITW